MLIAAGAETIWDPCFH